MVSFPAMRVASGAIPTKNMRTCPALTSTWADPSVGQSDAALKKDTQAADLPLQALYAQGRYTQAAVWRFYTVLNKDTDDGGRIQQKVWGNSGGNIRYPYTSDQI